jgi:hypothetical protein
MTDKNAVGLISQIQEKLTRNKTEICENEISNLQDLILSGI